jgi:hypothetical protein
MMLRALPLIPLFWLASCSEEPTAKEAEQAAKANAATDTAEAVKTEKRTILEAGDAAAKLIEEEARQEIESASGETAQQN